MLANRIFEYTLLFLLRTPNKTQKRHEIGKVVSLQKHQVAEKPKGQVFQESLGRQNRKKCVVKKRGIVLKHFCLLPFQASLK